MRGLQTACLLGAVAAPYAAGESYVVQDLQYVEGAGRYSKQSAAGLSKRGTPNGPVTIQPGGTYFVNMTIGGYQVPYFLLFDTGSGDLWVPAAGSDICNQNPTMCETYGSYSFSHSNSTGPAPSGFPNFSAAYADGTSVTGSYVTDTMNIFGAPLNNATFAVATEGSSPNGLAGILGAGFGNFETAAQKNGNYEYLNLPSLLLAEGQTQYNAYGLSLGSPNEGNPGGSLVFGGIDQARYEGHLQTLPLAVNASGVVSQFIVALTNVTFGTTSSVQTVGSGLPAAVRMDTGSAVDFLPPAIAQAVLSTLGAQPLPGSAFSVANCNFGGQDAAFGFQFGGPNGPDIQVPLSRYLQPLIVNGQQQTNSDGSPACLVPVSSAAAGDVATLGIPFLRNAYTVFDITGNSLALANRRVNLTFGSNILALPSGTSLPQDIAPSVINPVQVTTGIVNPSVLPGGNGARSMSISGSLIPPQSISSSAALSSGTVAPASISGSSSTTTTVYSGYASVVTTIYGPGVTAGCAGACPIYTSVYSTNSSSPLNVKLGAASSLDVSSWIGAAVMVASLILML